LSTDIFYVYEHWRPDESVIFYVGKGQKRRAWDTHRGRNPWHKFIVAKLKRLGLKHEVRIVHKEMTETAALAKERELIAHWRALGADLVNLTDGGEGPSGLKHTEEWKQALSKRMTGYKHSAESRAKMSAAAMGNTKGLGKKKPQHVIDKVAAANRGKKRTPAMNAHMSEVRKANPTFLGKHHTEELKAASSARQKGIPKPEWVKERMRKPKGEEHKRKLRALMTGVRRSPETRAKIAENSRLLWAKRRAEGTVDLIAQKMREGLNRKKIETVSVNLTLPGIEE
jgi:hypothetical protein